MTALRKKRVLTSMLATHERGMWEALTHARMRGRYRDAYENC